jgi:hypothetical protein
MHCTADFERISRLRRALEPFAVLYEKVVVESRVEPFEVRLRIEVCDDPLAQYPMPGQTVHIVDGESLEAAHDVWQEYRRAEQSMLRGRRAQ